MSSKNPFPYTDPSLHPDNLDQVPSSAYDALKDVGVLVPFPILSSCLQRAVAEMMTDEVPDSEIAEATDRIFVMLANFLTALFKILGGAFNYPPSAMAKIVSSVATSFKGRVLVVNTHEEALQKATEWNDGPLFYLDSANNKVGCIPPFYSERGEQEQSGFSEEAEKLMYQAAEALAQHPAFQKKDSPTSGKPTQH